MPRRDARSPASYVPELPNVASAITRRTHSVKPKAITPALSSPIRTMVDRRVISAAKTMTTRALGPIRGWAANNPTAATIAWSARPGVRLAASRMIVRNDTATSRARSRSVHTIEPVNQSAGNAAPAMAASSAGLRSVAQTLRTIT